MLDVTVSRDFSAPPEVVAAVMFDARRDAEWIGGAKKSEPLGPEPYGAGYRVRRTGGFLGRSFSWVTEIVGYEPGCKVEMKYVSGPFKGGVDYGVERRGGGSRVTVRNYGEATFSFPFMSALMRRSVAGDLKRLQGIVERGQ
jgi:hypothetical protein